MLAGILNFCKLVVRRPTVTQSEGGTAAALVINHLAMGSLALAPWFPLFLTSQSLLLLVRPGKLRGNLDLLLLILLQLIRSCMLPFRRIML